MVRGLDESSDTIILADSPNILFAQTAQGIMDIAYANAPGGLYKPGDTGHDRDIRHGVGSVCIFCDGHAKAYPPQKLIAEIAPL